MSIIIGLVFLLVVIWSFERLRAHFIQRRRAPEIIQSEGDASLSAQDGRIAPTPQHHGHHGSISHDGGSHHGGGGHDGGFGGDFGGGHGH